MQTLGPRIADAIASLVLIVFVAALFSFLGYYLLLIFGRILGGGFLAGLGTALALVAAIALIRFAWRNLK